MANNNNTLQQWIQSVNPFAKRSVDPSVIKKNLSNIIAPVQLQRFRQDVQTWRDIMVEAENAWYPHRVKAQRLFIDTINNAQVYSCMERRKDLTLLRKWEFIDKEGNIDQYTTDLFTETIRGKGQNKDWFSKFLSYSLDAMFFGYSLVSLGDVVNDGFPNLDLIKRWNVSPDRLNVTNFIYSISGMPFMEEPYRDWHVYVDTYNDIGSSKCGFGLLYKVGIYEIFLRNILGFNGDYVEMFAAPFRVGKTTKTSESERNELALALQQMGSAGWALIDPEDEISFLEAKTNGTGYKGYSDFEMRLLKMISKVILGHADAMDSIPGKLGNGKDGSPSDEALKDKQTKDGGFISNVVNNKLLVNMRNLGFAIPLETIAVLKNDSEIMESNNAVIAQAVEMNKAGLVMDGKYFTKQTGIPTAAAAVTTEFNSNIKNKLDKIYNKHEH
jgi:Protein of unknown function (DUF935)